MRDQLERAIKLAKKTGDRLLVYDSQKPDDTYVVMSIDEYEKIVDDNSLTEDEMTDKINRDIAEWKSEQFGLSAKDYHDDLKESSDNFNFAANESQKKEEMNEAGREKKSENPWKIPKDIKKGAENSRNIDIDK